MKVGDKVPVTLAGHVVTQAEVRELGDGTAVLVVPATQVTMAVRTELDTAPAPVKETETVITGVDRQEAGTEATVETTGAPESAVASDTADVSTTEATTVEPAVEAATSADTATEAPADVAPAAEAPVANDTSS